MPLDWTTLITAPLTAGAIAADLYLLRCVAEAIRHDRKRRAELKSKYKGTRTMNKLNYSVAAATLLLPAAAFAQPAGQPPAEVTPGPAPLVISTDRPSFSDGTGIVPLGHFQLETGYTYTHRDRDGVETNRQNGPEALGRVALIDDRLELRLIWSGWVDAETKTGSTTTHASGWSDATIGIKLKLIDQGELASWTPRLALGAQTTLGGGGQQVATQEEEPTIKLLWSYDLAKCCGDSCSGWSVGGNFNLAWPTSGEGTDHYEQFQASIYVNAPLFDRCTGFAEYYVLSPNADGQSEAHYADLGAVYLLNDRIQLDARIGFGLNHEADNLFAGVGISFLF